MVRGRPRQTACGQDVTWDGVCSWENSLEACDVRSLGSSAFLLLLSHQPPWWQPWMMSTAVSYVSVSFTPAEHQPPWCFLAEHPFSVENRASVLGPNFTVTNDSSFKPSPREGHFLHTCGSSPQPSAEPLPRTSYRGCQRSSGKFWERSSNHMEIAHPFHRCDLHLRLPENATIAPCQQIYQRLGYCICNNTVCERRVTQSAMNCTSLFPAPSQALRKHGEIAQSMSSLSRFCFSCKRASSSSANEDTARLQAPAIEQRVVRATS
ncbi:uncharacterized protein [Kogia breviceps]|uniref:uncharacterized protein isoform X2 n=1 Tax=Kogia breviceps TaxID=27615 RepID=UPI0034D1C074